MFWKNFYFLCEQKNMKPLQVVKEIGIAHGNITNWKKGKLPSGTNLAKIADYFGVSVDSLLADAPTIPDRPGAELAEMDAQNVHMIPIFENVSAGFGALAVNEVVDYIPLYIKSPAEAGETICIKVKGNSMSPKIESGDLIQVHKQDAVDSGSLAVVLVDGNEGLVKIVTHGEGWIELRSLNTMYKPLRFNGADVLRVRVVGIVNKIIKSVTGKQEIVYPPIQSENKDAILRMIGTFDEAELKQLEQYVEFLHSKKNKQ